MFKILKIKFLSYASDQSPQRWAMQSGYGCALLKTPELMEDLTKTLRRNFPAEFSISVKIRVQKPLK